MISPHRVLWVKATEADIREIDSVTGAVLTAGSLRWVGKDNSKNILQDGQKVLYHSQYVKALKEGDLLPMDQETANACGVAFVNQLQEEIK